MSNWIIPESQLADLCPDARGSIFAVGNGATTTRGTNSESGTKEFRGTYCAGAYTPAGWGLKYLLQAPDWLPAAPMTGSLTNSERRLDLEHGILIRQATLQAPGINLSWREERAASWHDSRLMLQRLTLEIEELEQDLCLSLGLDGDIYAHPAKYYHDGDLPNCTPQGVRLTEVVETAADAEHGLLLCLVSPQSNRHSAAAARCFSSLKTTYHAGSDQAQARLTLPAGSRGTVVIDKLAAISAERRDDDHARDTVLQAIEENRDPEQAWANHLSAIADFWQQAAVVIDGDDASAQAVNFALWATRIAAPDDQGQSSIGAKNLTGDWYRGAVFWDMEMFQLPVLAVTAPQCARNHILYRWQRLDAARQLAAQDGYTGARYPWQSYASGLEEPPVLGGFLYTQQHVSLAVAWGAIYYYWVSGDSTTMLEAGLEMCLEIASFWRSRYGAADANGRYHLSRITGPDEDHQTVDDEAYTMVLSGWLFSYLPRLLAQLRAVDDKRVEQLLALTAIDDEEIARWQEIASNSDLPYLSDGETLAQYAGFEAVAEPDETARGVQGKRSDKPTKQTATLLLWQVLPQQFSDQELAINWRQHAPLCNHGSSLSFCSHALLAARLGYQRDAWRFFAAARGIDLEDSHGNSAHGIHGAGQGGIWMATVHGFGGVKIGEAGLHINPRLPDNWQALQFTISYQGQALQVAMSKDSLSVSHHGKQAITAELAGSSLTLPAGETTTVHLDNNWQKAELAAVIFDLDGVLVTTDQYHYQAWKAMADEVGLPFNEQVNHQLRGVSREESLKRIYANAKVELPDQATFNRLLKQKNDQYVQLIGQMSAADILPGAVTLLQDLRANGIKTAIASASRNTPLVLQRTGLDAYVDAVADGNIVTRSKPDPQVFYLAAQRLRVLPWNCVGVEDAAAGVEAINRAGMVACGIGSEAVAAEINVATTKELTLAVVRQAFADFENTRNPYHEGSVERMKEDQATSYATTLASK